MADRIASADVVVRPVTAADRDDIVTVSGTRGAPARCQWSRLLGEQWRPEEGDP